MWILSATVSTLPSVRMIPSAPIRTIRLAAMQEKEEQRSISITLPFYPMIEMVLVLTMNLLDAALDLE